MKISPKKIPINGDATISVDVQNAGKVKGDEIVEMYIHDIVSFPTRPVEELKDFTRISLNPGEKRTVTFHLTPDKLKSLNLKMKNVVQPGKFEIMVGKSSTDVLRDTLNVVQS